MKSILIAAAVCAAFAGFMSIAKGGIRLADAVDVPKLTSVRRGKNKGPRGSRYS